MTENSHTKLESVAGAGKTYKLKKMLPELEGSVLFITFNASLKDESKPLERQFPNLEVTTFHAFAKRAITGLIGPFTPKPAYYNSELKEMFGLQTTEATGYIRMIEDFSYSRLRMGEFIEFVKSSNVYLDFLGLKPSQVERFRGIWNALIEKRLITHDVYFKLFQLNSPKLLANYIVLDEFQDFSDAMIDVIEQNQYAATIIKAGDSMQRIYEWRGASGQFLMNFANVENLRNSRRCPAEIVAVANPYTKFLADVEMGSHAQRDGRVTVYRDMKKQLSRGLFPKQDCAFIARKNSTIYEAADNFVRQGFNVVVDSGASFDDIKRHWLWLNNYPTDSFLARFPSHAEKALIKYYLDSGQDDKVALIGAAKTIKDIFQLENSLGIIHPDRPTVTITTVFRSKGLGFDNVILADDFNSPKGSQGLTVLREEDLKVIYVAITRAKQTLFLPDTLYFEDELYIGSGVFYVEPIAGESLLEKKIRERKEEIRIKELEKEQKKSSKKRKEELRRKLN